MRTKNTLKKIILVTILILAIKTLLLEIIYAQQTNQDLLEIVNPKPNQMISNPIDIVWKMFDNDQNGIKYSIKIFDRLECGRVDFGSINETTIGISSLTTENKIKWNGKTTSKISELSDGKYCLKICGVYKNIDSEYSLCRSQEIRVNFKNKSPKFTSVPQSQTNIVAGNYWEFKISASDPENDKLTFRLIQTPPFLSINKDGLLKTNTGVWTIPSNVNNLIYNVEIGVSDDINDEVKTSFKLNVEKRQGNLQNEPSSIQIEFPKANENVTLSNNEISFLAKDKEGIEKIILEYSSDLREWETIKSINKPTSEKLNVKWEINNIPEGEYYIRINVIDQQNILTTKVSDKFKLTKSESSTNNEDTNSVLFSPIYPEKNQKLKETPSQISFNIILPKNFDTKIKENTLKVEINEIDVTTQCKIEELKVECANLSLNFGKHSIKASIEDEEGRTYSDFWSFESEQTNENDTLNDNTNLSASAIPIILAICGAVSLILFIPWMIIRIIKKRRNENEAEIVNTEENTYYTIPENMVTSVYTPEENINDKNNTIDYEEIENLANANELINSNQSIDPETISIEELEKLYPELSVNESTEANKTKNNN